MNTKAKDQTPVRPFSNATEAEWWKDHNCYQCNKYEMVSESEEKARCKLAWHLDIGYTSGTIPRWVGEEIGCIDDPLTFTEAGIAEGVQLRNDCRKRKI